MPSTASIHKKRIAIVGSGISGLAALYSLRDSGHELHLYEQDDRLGGHTNTKEWQCKASGETIQVDTGFIVINTATYPNLLNFLADLGIKTVPTQMTFAVSRDYGAFEWSGDSPWCQWSNFFSPSHWRMLYDFVHFNTFATDILREPKCDENEMTIGGYLEKHGYSKAFRDNYLLPMTACVWSTGPEKCALDFPAVTLIRFMMNHKLLNTVSKRPQWLTIPGGSIQYIQKLMEKSTHFIHKSSKVVSVGHVNKGDGIEIALQNGQRERFDDVVLACHADQAYKLRSDMSKEEESIISAFETTASTAYLHSDRRVSHISFLMIDIY
jgi:predicted NAD/FAD-binding protein